ncbi:MAG: toxin-antitoxin system HicB family antitoxin [candidate division KSB1 bacterium]|nr:toxin-antitoxin system HicB family antitoxin [candidate division KSB1 bacterium]
MKKLDYYMNLNYPIEIQKIPEDQGGGYQACIPLLGKYAFLGDGETVEEALENLNETKEYLFNRYLERGIKIPEPVTEEEKEYSGRFVLRIPNELHRSLALEAKKNDSTLNQFCLYLLTRKSYLNTIQEEVKLIHQQVTDIFNHIKEISYDVEQLSWPQHEKCANVVDMNHYEYPQCG